MIHDEESLEINLVWYGWIMEDVKSQAKKQELTRYCNDIMKELLFLKDEWHPQCLRKKSQVGHPGGWSSIQITRVMTG